MPISTFQYQQMLAKVGSGRKGLESLLDGAGAHTGPESALHDMVEQLCLGKGWFYRHERMDKRTTGKKGCPDFTICTERDTYWLELKRKGSKPTIEQLGAIAHLKKLNKKAAILDNMEAIKDFLIS